MAAVQAHHRLFLASTCAGQQRRRLRPSRIAAPCRAAVSGGVRTAQSPSSSSSGSGSPSSLRLNLDWVDPRVVAVPTSSPGAQVEVEKLRAIAEAAADRAEMHDIIGRQRDNWNHLLLHSNNSLALAASVMAALAPAAPTVVALKASAGVLLASAAVTMAAVNKIQPSQLAEEQRNATRLWRQLERDVRVTLALAAPVTRADVHDAMDRILALDAAYPLPRPPRHARQVPQAVEPTRCGRREATAAARSGEQLGMVFELLRNCAGFYRKMQEEIEANLGEADVERREDGEVLETKVALQLGRSTSELKQFRRLASPSFKDDDVKDFAGKLF
uniref:F-box protein n=1 Tax=Oryza barthii TaxID=65489 RepID=A0A0D3F2N3_9ORYZ